MQPSIEFFFLIILIYRPRPFYAHKELLHDHNFHMTVKKKILITTSVSFFSFLKTIKLILLI